MLYFLAVLSVTFAALILMPRQFISEASLFVRVGRETVGLDPTATTGQTVDLLASQEGEIFSAVNLLRSQQLFETVVDDVGAELILEPQTTLAQADPQVHRASLTMDWAKPAVKWLHEMRLLDSVSQREKAIKELRKSIDIENARKSSVIMVSCQSHSPELAQSILTKFLDEYQQQHSRIHRTAGSFAFFSSQAEVLRRDLVEAEELLRDAKTSGDLVSLTGQKAVLEEQMKLLNQELTRTEATLAASESRIEAAQTMNPEWIDWTRSPEAVRLNNVTLNGMRDQLYTLQLRERELLTKFEDQDPRVMSIKEQVKHAQDLLGRQELLNEFASAQALRATADSLRSQNEQMLEKLRLLNEREVIVQQLQRQVDLADENYRKYQSNVEQARIDQELQLQRISNVNIAQAPTLVEDPVAPNKPLLAILGLFVAVTGSIGIAITAEGMNTRLRDEQDVANLLDMPVLVTVPRTSPRSLRVI